MGARDAPRYPTLNSIQKRQQRLPLTRRHLGKRLPRPRRLAATPEDGLSRVPRTPIMQHRRIAIHDPRQPQPPKRRSTPVTPARGELGPVIGLPLSHVMQQEIRVGMDRLRVVDSSDSEGLEFRVVA